MKDKKLYKIIKANCIVSRKCGIKELETFSFLENMDKLHCPYGNKSQNFLISKQIDFYNEFCPEDYDIINFENVSFEIVGELWL